MWHCNKASSAHKQCRSFTGSKFLTHAVLRNIGQITLMCLAVNAQLKPFNNCCYWILKSVRIYLDLNWKSVDSDSEPENSDLDSNLMNSTRLHHCLKHQTSFFRYFDISTLIIIEGWVHGDCWNTGKKMSGALSSDVVEFIKFKSKSGSQSESADFWFKSK